MIELDEPEFEGHDYCELIDKWGLRFEIDCANGAVNELKDIGIDVGDAEIDYRVIQRYILQNVSIDDEGNEKLPQDMIDDIKEFLIAICYDENTAAGDASVMDAIMDLAEGEDHYWFILWFVHCLPLMWN